MFRSFIAILALLSAASCTTKLSIDDLPPEGRRTGTVDAHQLVEIFNDTCMAHYPNDLEVAREFLRNGFEQTRGPDLNVEAEIDELRVFSLPNTDISARVGTSVIHWTGVNTGGVDIHKSCTLSADLAKPAEMEAALGGILSPSGESIEFLINDTVGENFVVIRREAIIMSSSGLPLEVSYAQTLRLLEIRDGAPSERCNGLDRCVVWQRANLTIGFPKP